MVPVTAGGGLKKFLIGLVVLLLVAGGALGSAVVWKKNQEAQQELALRVEKWDGTLAEIITKIEAEELDEAEEQLETIGGEEAPTEDHVDRLENTRRRLRALGYLE